MNREPISRRGAFVLITAIFAIWLMYAGILWRFFAYTFSVEVYPAVISIIIFGTAYMLHLSVGALVRLVPALFSTKSATAPGEKK